MAFLLITSQGLVLGATHNVLLTRAIFDGPVIGSGRCHGLGLGLGLAGNSDVDFGADDHDQP